MKRPLMKSSYCSWSRGSAVSGAGTAPAAFTPYQRFATGLLTLLDLDAIHEIDIAPLARYVASMELPDGGFHGAAWDPAHDVEYTFYGLGCRALLASLNT